MWQRVAAQQHGLVSRSQLLAAGLLEGAIWRRLVRHELEQVLPGVYRVPGSPATWLQSLMGVCLWAGNGASASHRAAAALWDIDGFPEGPLEVRAFKKNQLSSKFRVHQPAADGRHVTRKRGIPVTNATATVADLAGSLGLGRLERVVDDALRQGLVSLRSLADFVASNPRRRGVSSLRRLLEGRDPDAKPASELHMRVRNLLLQAGLTGFHEEYEIRGANGVFLARPDFVFVDERVVVEADSIRHHAGTVDFAEDLDRRNRLTAEHWSMLHVTWADLKHRRAKRQDEIRRALNDPHPGSPI